MLAAYAYINIFCAVLSLCLAAFIIYRSRPLMADKIFFSLMLLAISGWCFGIYMHAFANTSVEAYLWSLRLHQFAFFIPVFYFIFVFYFIASKSKLFLGLICVDSLLCLLLEYVSLYYPKLLVSGVFDIAGFQYFPKAGPLYFLYVWQFALTIFIASLFLIDAILKQKSYLAKQRNKYILISTLIGFPCASFTILPMYNINVFPYGNFLTFLFVIVLVYSIIKYRLMDIEVVIKRGFCLFCLNGSDHRGFIRLSSLFRKSISLIL